MKNKILGFLICVICLFGIVGCGKKIKLTNDNYDEYLRISVYPSCKGSATTNCKIVVATSGKTENFNYHDIKVVVKVKGTYKAHRCDYYGCVMGADCVKEISETTIELEGSDITGASSTGAYFLEGGFGTETNEVDLDYQIVEVSGNVTPA